MGCSNERAPEASGTLDTEHLDEFGGGGAARVQKEGLHPAYRASRTLRGVGFKPSSFFFKEIG